MREQETELFRLKDVEQQYHEYLRSWEPLWEAARERGGYALAVFVSVELKEKIYHGRDYHIPRGDDSRDV